MADSVHLQFGQKKKKNRWCLKLTFWLQPGKFTLQGSRTLCLFYNSQRCMFPRENAAEFAFSQRVFRVFRAFSWSCRDVHLEMRQKRLKQHWSHLTSGKKPNQTMLWLPFFSVPRLGLERKQTNNVVQTWGRDSSWVYPKRNLSHAHKSYSVDGNSMQQMGQSGESLPKHSVASSQNAKADKTIKRLKTQYPSQCLSWPHLFL